MGDQRESWSRREFVSGLTLAGTAGFAGIRPARVGAEPPPETTRLRLYHSTSVCVAPQYIVGELLKAEGFSDIKYVKTTTAGISKVLASGEVDVSLHFVAPLVIQLDAGDPITVLGGVHPGCFELFGTDRVRVLRDLKGKTVAITELGQPAHVFLSSMLAHVGLDPKKDVTFAEHPAAESKRLLAAGKVDAYLAFTPDPEDSVRFYALRLHEAGMIKASPQKIIAQGTDWRFFNELKRELKG